MTHLVTLVVIGVLASLLLDATESVGRALVEELVARELAPVPRRGFEAFLWCLLAIAVARTSLPRPAATRDTLLLLWALVGVQLVRLTAEVHGTGAGVPTDVWLWVPLLASVALFGLSSTLGPQRLLSVLLVIGLPAVALSLLAGGAGLAGAVLGDSDRLGGSTLASGRLRGAFTHPLYLAAVSGFLVLVASARLGERVTFPSTRPRSRAVTVLLVGAAVLGFTGLIGADGLTATVALASALIATFLVRRLDLSVWSPALRRTIAAVGGVTVAAFPFVLGSSGLGDLTGRVHVWTRILDTLTPREWAVGLGADPMSRGTALFDRLDTDWGAMHAHSQSLDLLVEVGVIGPIAVAALGAALVLAALRACEASRGWSVGIATYLLVLWLTDEVVTSQFFAYQFVTVGSLGLIFAWSTPSSRPTATATPSSPEITA
jgi:hypothetical protein